MNHKQFLHRYQNLIQTKFPLSQVVYMKVGGLADYYVKATDQDTLLHLLTDASEAGIKTFVLGGGTNTLFTDAGFRGLVIQNAVQSLSLNHHQITVSAGYSLNALVNQANEAGLAGLANFYGIPGTVGGAIYNNAHYLNDQIGNYVSQVTVLSTNGKINNLSPQECKFGYDDSLFQHQPFTILKVKFSLQPQDPSQLKTISRSALVKRQTSQPLNYPSSGCIFKNPGQAGTILPPLLKARNLTTAGAMIDQAGLKGKQIGGAMVSKIHANFIVNVGQATAKDVAELIQYVADQVYQQFNVKLEKEVFFIEP